MLPMRLFICDRFGVFGMMGALGLGAAGNFVAFNYALLREMASVSILRGHTSILATYGGRFCVIALSIISMANVAVNLTFPAMLRRRLGIEGLI